MVSLRLKHSEGGMRCSSGETLSEEQLSAAIDGHADEKVLAHLASCPQCATRLAMARTTETFLGSSLYRFDCPSSQELIDYHLGLVNSSTDKRITRHLALCVACREEIETLRGFLLADHPHAHIAAPVQCQSKLVSALNDIVASILPRNPQFVVRGTAHAAVSARAGNTTVLLVPEQDQQQQLTLAGQLLDDNLEQWIGAQVEIYQETQLVHSTVIDELGGFAIQSLTQSSTTVRIIPATGQAIVVPAIEL